MPNLIPGNLIVDRAVYWWKDGKCKETSTNRSPCIDAIKRRYDGSPDDDPWCAQFVWVCVDEAADQYGVKNSLPKTAQALELLNLSKKIFVVNKVPSVGSIFYHLPTSGGTGHVGIVQKVDKNGIISIDGNSSDKVNWYRHSAERVAGKLNYQFIHVEKEYEAISSDNAKSIAAFSFGLFASYFVIKNLG